MWEKRYPGWRCLCLENVETAYPGKSGACRRKCKAGCALPARADMLRGRFLSRLARGRRAASANPHHCQESRVTRSRVEVCCRARPQRCLCSSLYITCIPKNTHTHTYLYLYTLSFLVLEWEVSKFFGRNLRLDPGASRFVWRVCFVLQAWGSLECVGSERGLGPSVQKAALIFLLLNPCAQGRTRFAC